MPWTSRHLRDAVRRALCLPSGSAQGSTDAGWQRSGLRTSRVLAASSRSRSASRRRGGSSCSPSGRTRCSTSPGVQATAASSVRGRRRETVSATSPSPSCCPAGHPRLSPGRLRSTWMLAHLVGRDPRHRAVSGGRTSKPSCALGPDGLFGAARRGGCQSPAPPGTA